MKFREFKTNSGKKVLAGKDAGNNEELVKQAKDNEIVLHTATPGSPFVNIKTKGSKTPITKQDIKEAAVFCAKYSKAWKKPKTKPKEIEIHYFLGKDISKNKGMKLGTFGVKKFKKIIVKKKDIEKFEGER